MLRFGCESCLLSNIQFSELCFELIANRLLQDPEDGGESQLLQQLEICEFLVAFWKKFL